MNVIGSTAAHSSGDVVITFVVDRCPTGQDLMPLWSPPEGRVYKELLKAGYIAANGTVLKHFRSDSVVPEPIKGGRYRVTFRYHLANDSN